MKKGKNVLLTAGLVLAILTLTNCGEVGCDPTRDSWCEEGDSSSSIGGLPLSSNGGNSSSSVGGGSSSSGGDGTDNYGFSALPGGNGFSGGSFDNVGYYGLWWSASEDGSYGAYGRNMDYDIGYAYWGSYDKSNLFSVRCVQD